MGCILELKVRHIKDWNQLLWVCTCDLVPPVPVPIARMRQKQEGEGHGGQHALGLCAFVSACNA